MFRPLALYIGLRYTRAKKKTQFVSFISFMSMLGIALGVMVLITVLSVMNGFDAEIRERLFALVPHIVINDVQGRISDWPKLEKKIETIPNVTSVIPLASGQAMLIKNNQTAPAIVNGIVLAKKGQILDLNHKMTMGALSSLSSTPFGIVLGAGIAANLGVVVGDSVNMLIPVAAITPVGIIPRFKQVKVVGIFSAGAGFGFDDGYAFMKLPDAQKIFMLGNEVTALQVNVSNLFLAPRMAMKIQQELGDEYEVIDWTDQFGAFYHAVQMEKTMMFLILLLIIAVAAFNLVSSLMMGVNDKAADIAILRTLGATPRFIMLIFITQGAIIGSVGVFLGALAGILLSFNITWLVDQLQRIFQLQLINPNVYFVSFLPSRLQWADVALVIGVSLLMAILATIYPAWRASKIQPAEALRYE